MELVLITLFASTTLALGYLYLRRKPAISLNELEAKYVLRKDLDNISFQLNQKSEEVAHLRQKLGGKQKLDEQMGELEDKFEILSQRMIKESLKQLQEDSGKNMAQVIDPFKDQLSEFRKSVDKARETSMRDSENLKSKLSQLSELNQNLSSEARNLTRALTMDSKKRGNWGEMVLETLLEKSGLTKNIHYRREVMGVSDGTDLRADVIINLPGERHLVIDSKVTLNAYLNFTSSEHDEDAAMHLSSHIAAVKNHIKTLGTKRYDRIHNITSPDFVLMFMPLEPAFHDALRNDPDLYLFAMERNVVLVTASTLLAALTTISTSWQQDLQRQNVDKMADLAGKLYDQVNSFVKDMEGIQSHLHAADQSYKNAAKRLATGNNNVIRLTGKMKDLGAKVKDRKDESVGEFLEKYAS